MSWRSLPHLNVVRDPERMRNVIQGYLQPADGSTVEIERCAVDFVRPQPGRCLLQYTLDLVETRTRREIRQVVTGIMLEGDRGRALWQRLLDDDPSAVEPIGAAALPPIAFVPELGLLLQVFPYDYRLPALRTMLYGALELGTAFAAELDGGDWRIETWDATLVRYRPELRATLRLDLELRGGEPEHRISRRIYAKIYRDAEPGERGRRLLQTLWELTTNTDAGFNVARPITYLGSMNTLLVNEVTGERLLDIVRHDDADAISLALRRTGRAVAGLHQLPLPAESLPAARRDDRSRFATIAEALDKLDPSQAQDVQEIMSVIATRFDANDEPRAPTHFDLKPGNILFDGERVTLLDFDKLAWGDPLVDVANLMANLGRELGGTKRRNRRQLGPTQVFAEEYLSHVPGAWREQLPARYAFAVLADAATAGRGLRGRPEHGNRNGRVAKAVERAWDALSGTYR